MTLFIDVRREVDKASALRRSTNTNIGQNVELDISVFSNLPGSPFSYSAPPVVFSIFENFPTIQSKNYTAVGGMKTQGDFRFLRLWWETKLNDAEAWVPLSKGGEYAIAYGDIPLKAHWLDNGRELRAYYDHISEGMGWGGFGRNEEHYLRPGITWSRRPHLRGSFRLLPAGVIFGSDGPAVFSPSPLALCAILNSIPFLWLLGFLMARGESGGQTLKYEVGYVASTPIPDLPPAEKQELENLCRKLWTLQYRLAVARETGHGFELPPPLMRREPSHDVTTIKTECIRVQAEIDNIAYRLYGIDGEDRAIVEAWERSILPLSAKESKDEIDSEDKIFDGHSTISDAETMLSWAVGVAFGRFDIRLATGERAIPPDPGPFDLLPAKSPGMLPEGDPPFSPCNGVLVDDQGDANDFVTRIAAVYDRIGETERELDVLRRTLARDFFSAHIKMYSKSRRKAPIYWQLATPSTSYSVWLYVHAFTKDTLFRVQNDHASPKLAHEQRRLEAIRAEAGPNPSEPQHKSIVTMEALVEELQAFVEDVKRIAPLWDPNLDDGVIINMAPLWRLMPQHKTWQNELKTTWDALCAGTYDWTNLAMHLWPERVIPKCAEDRSLAIAHGLEEVFWFEDEDGKWKAYEEPQKPIAKLISERTSAAVKAALKGLLDAPEPASGAKRSRKSKAA
jgi:hypothetical protein